MKSKMLKDALQKFNSVENASQGSDLEPITIEEAFRIVGGTQESVVKDCGAWGGACTTWGGSCGTWG